MVKYKPSIKLQRKKKLMRKKPQLQHMRLKCNKKFNLNIFVVKQQKITAMVEHYSSKFAL